MAIDPSKVGPRRYSPRPLEIEAIQFNGQNADEVIAFSNGGIGLNDAGDGLLIETLEGVMQASVGDYIIRGTAGEYYPAKPHLFATKYEDRGPVEA